MWSLPGLNHPHSFEHLKDKSTHNRLTSLFIDESIERRADDVRKEPTGKSHAIDCHHRSPVPRRANSRANTRQPRSANENIGFGDYGK